MSVAVLALVLALLTALLLGASLGALLFFRGDFRPPEPASLLELAEEDGFAYLVENSLPYPGSLRTDRPLLELSGPWLARRALASGDWEPEGVAVDLPACLNHPDGPDRDFAGPLLYERDFVLPRAFQEGFRPRLCVEASFLHTRVLLDGTQIGSNSEGYLPFYLDLGGRLRPGAVHRLGLIVDGRLEATSLPPRLYEGSDPGWHPYAGPQGRVLIEALPRVYCVKIRPEVREGRLRLRALYHRPGRGGAEDLSVDIGLGSLKAGGNPVFKAGAAYALLDILLDKPGLEAWSPASPQLHRLSLGTSWETCSLDFGLRDFRLGRGRFELGKETFLAQGAALHDCDPVEGRARSLASVRADLEGMKALGANFVRLAHYPHGQATLDLCDSLGLGAWAEIPLYQAGLGIVKALARKSRTRRLRLPYLPALIAHTGDLGNPVLLGRARDSLLKLIERDANHPSILMWGLGNECWSFNPRGAKALAWLKAEASRLDSSRPFVYAGMALPGISGPFERAYGVTGVVAVNEYFGWYYGAPEDARAFLADLGKRWPGAPVFVSETGADAVPGRRDPSGKPGRNSEDYQAHCLRVQLAAFKDIPNWSGVSVWAWRDFPCPEYREDAPMPYRNIKGLLCEDGRPKLALGVLGEHLAGGRKET